MSFPLHFSYQGVEYSVRLEPTHILLEKALSLQGRDYKILGNEEDVASLRQRLANLETSQFESVSDIEASLVQERCNINSELGRIIK